MWQKKEQNMMHVKSQTHHRGGTLQKFSLIELLIVVAIIAMLAGMLLPALNKARERAHLINCASNIRQIGTTLAIYTSDSHDFYPPYSANGDPVTENWPHILRANNYLTSGKLLYCPSIRPSDPRYAINGSHSAAGGVVSVYRYKFISYGYNWRYFGSSHARNGSLDVPTMKSTAVKNPSMKIVIADARQNGTGVTNGFYTINHDLDDPVTDGVIDPRHSPSNLKGTVNILMADSHVTNFINFNAGDHESDEMVEKYWNPWK